MAYSNGEERSAMKISELIGRPLDVAVEIALQGGQLRPDYNPRYTPEHSTNWSQGGPIIEREKISTMWSLNNQWHACTGFSAQGHLLGPTPLIAAMRTFVTSKLGDEVEIPEELL